MDIDNHDLDISSALVEVKNLYSAHEESKKNQKELAEFVSLLREEVKLARDAEKAAEFKKTRSQAYVIQQQEVIQKLLNVKEENEELRRTMSQLKTTISDLQNNSMNEHVRKDAEIQEIKQSFLDEVIKFQESADAKLKDEESQAKKIKADLEATIQELKTTISKNQENIDALQADLKDAQERSAVNLDIFQKKLADQEQKYQAELETWKMAEISRTTFEKVQSGNNSGQYGTISNTINNPYQPSVFKQMQEYPNQNIPPNLGNSYTSQSYNQTFQPYANQYQHRTNQYNPNLQPYHNQNQQPYPNHYDQNQPPCPAQYNPNPQPSSTQYNPNPQSTSNLPLVTRIRNVYPRSVPVNNVHPSGLPQPQPASNQPGNSFNKEFQTANELYMKDQDSTEKMEGMLDASSEHSVDKNPPVQNPKAPVPRKKRKLFNPNENLL